MSNRRIVGLTGLFQRNGGDEANEALQSDFSEILRNQLASRPTKRPVNTYWCAIEAFELVRGFVENNPFNVSYDRPQVSIQCAATDSTDSGNPVIHYGYCINTRCESATALTLTARLSRKPNGEVWLTCLSKHPVFVQSHHLDQKNPGLEHHTICSGDSCKIFDLKEYCQEVIFEIATKQNAERTDEDTCSNNFGTDKLKESCVLVLWYDLGDGKRNQNCWFKIHLKEALVMLEDILNATSTVVTPSIDTKKYNSKH